MKSNLIVGFSVVLLSDTSVSNLVSQGYYVVEDVELDFHSVDNKVQDASRIGEITGSSLAKIKFNWKWYCNSNC